MRKSGWVPKDVVHEAYDADEVVTSPFACDVHTHTLASRHAYSTIGECVETARRSGIALLGSTDHFSAMISGSLHIRDYQYFINFEMWPRLWNGVWVLRGVEADIVDLKGHLYGWDLHYGEGITGRSFDEPRTLKQIIWGHIDYAIASIHNDTFTEGATIAQTTDMYVRALEDPKVLILGHVGRAGVPFDLDTLLIAAKERHKLIEINEHSFAGHYDVERRRRCVEVACRCAELGVMIACGTDAHIATDIGRFDAVAELLDEIHFPPELIATASARRFLSLLPDRGLLASYDSLVGSTD